jgi:hypothetical protein
MGAAIDPVQSHTGVMGGALKMPAGALRPERRVPDFSGFAERACAMARSRDNSRKGG